MRSKGAAPSPTLSPATDPDSRTPARYDREPPYSLDPDVVRNAKMEVLRCLRPITGKDVEKFTARAQYTEGTAHGEPMPSYRREKGLNPTSTTETYVAVKSFVENWR